jgi:hypothetical protein
MALRPAVDLQKLALTDQIADPSPGLIRVQLGLATATRAVPARFQFHELGKASDQLGDTHCLINGPAAVGDGDCAIRLALDMCQDNAVGIDDRISRLIP